MQYRLRTLFIATTVIAVLFWALFSPPQWLGLLALYAVYLLLPAAIVAGIAFHRGYWQAFFVGVGSWLVATAFARVVTFPGSILGSTLSVTSGFDWLLSGEFIPSDEDQIIIRKTEIVVWIAIGFASGVVAVAVRWWAISLRKQAE